MKHLKYISFILAIFAMNACNSWLDVSPKSEIRGEDHYKTVDGFKQTLIGCYISMTHADLYGKNLSWYMTEILANQYEKDYRDDQGKALYEHQYQNSGVVILTKNIWDKMYNIIVNVNDALRYLQDSENKMTPIEYRQIRGELYALRAYLHFDLMRLYGESTPKKDFAKWASLKSIPYQTDVTKNFPPQKTNAETVAMIMEDIERALEDLKSSDPLVSEHPFNSYNEINSDGFFNLRNLRLNYLSVLALKARLFQWQGTPEKMKECRSVADMILNLVTEATNRGAHFDTKIGMIPAKKVKASNLNLFEESLFGLEVPKISEKIASYLRIDFANKVYAMWIAESRAKAIFENSNIDIRFTKQMIKGTGYPSGYVPAKLFQADLGENRGRLSLLRLSEIYLMGAEASLLSETPDIEHARELVSMLRLFRGHTTEIKADVSSEELLQIIYKEYQREFFAEGVQFFVYKRLGLEKISSNEDSKMTPEDYRLPFPDFEINAGRTQASN
ncbi:RagB/SusD family nutrient uptake outer membrane protein [Porphyromonas sp.]|uniref:RagB/SusD family nutrient uptake outer membrane protein n=1 Tax=Porphyromonas sp. TaxID=1924944 RepID=UPI0026DD47E3|nr:RagB/SusD family nutrient uptake outer membrane protein [Porphyromonas sp.]MDO4770638.1 RagB/SusD family nutrient uptake outer membrane protein [Porphyromonas sp.]